MGFMDKFKKMVDGIDEEDKIKADAYATRPVGGVSDDYVSYLGSYYFTQDPSATPIAADRKYISLSNQEDCVNSLRFVWAGMLIFLGTMVTHDYSMGKNVITVLGTIVGMVFIMFLAVLFTTLIGKIVSLITNIVTEIQYRL